MNTIQIKPDKNKLLEYVEDFERGKLQVPAFQRDFVWTNEKKLDLFDSIRKGYPIGSVLLWRPDFQSEDEYVDFGSDRIGSYTVPKRSSEALYILDGYQRLSTLLGCLVNPNKAKAKGIERDSEEWKKEFNIVYNLNDQEFEINRKEYEQLEIFQIPVYRLVDGKEFYDFQKSLLKEDESKRKQTDREYIDRYEEISLVFQKYELPNINLFGGSISEAVDIFQRLNSTGAPITKDWVVSALAYGKDSAFRLGTEIDKLLENSLSVFNFQNIKRELILQCITNSFGGVYFDQVSKNNNKKLEDLVKRDDFIPITITTFESLKKAVGFLFQSLFVLDSKLVPYNSQIIFITDFFSQVAQPSESQLMALKKWFWITTYANYFTIYNLSKQRLAYNKFQEFIKSDTDPVFYDKINQKFSSLSFPKKIDMGSVRSKSLALFMLNYAKNRDNILDGLCVNAEDIDCFKTYRLFADRETPNVSENTILIIENRNVTNNLSKKIIDLSTWLNPEYQGQFEEFFITNEMRDEFAKGNIDKVLEIRKQLIIEKEWVFVMQLGLDYEP